MSMQRTAERLLKAASDVFEGRRQSEDEPDTAGEMQTRRRLMLAGREVFGRKGPSVTVREICYAAKANIAAVNYHFGSKEGLLAEVLAELLDELLVMYPMHGGVQGDAPAKERLHGFVFAFLCRILLPFGREDERMLGLMLSEAFVRPIRSFEAYAQKHRDAVREFLSPLLLELARKGEVTAQGPDDRRIQMIVRSIVAQILFYNTNRAALMAQREGKPFKPDEILDVALHITSFSLGGINHISEQLK